MKGDRPRPFTNAATDCGLPRIEAPSTITAIIEQVATDPTITSRITCGVSDPCPQATSAAPSTPTAAASDGVARPPYIEPSTQAIRNRAGPSSLNEARYSARDAILILRSLSGTS